MAVINTTRYNSLDELRQNTNEVSERVGDTETLATEANDLTSAINEHEGDVGSMELDTTASNLTDAINEHEADIGSMSLDTTATNLTDAVNEHEADIGDMELTDLAASDLSSASRELRTGLGDVSTLKTQDNVVDASNKIYDDLYTAFSQSFDGLTATYFKSAVEEIVDELGQVTNLTTTNKVAVDAINELHSDVGNLSLNTTATNLTAAINEHESDIGSMSLNTSSSNLTAAINEHEADIGSMSLDTTATNLTAAINELESDLYTSGTVSFNNLTSTNFKSAIEELESEKVYLSSAVNQSISSDLTIESGNTLTVNGTLDVSSGQLQVPVGSGELAVSTTFISLGGEVDNQTGALNGGMKLNRGYDNNTNEGVVDWVTLNDVQIFWDETDQSWKVKSVTGTEENETVTTAKLLDFENAKELFANNTESGINVSWDNINNNFDVNVKDNGIVLGTQTTGNYVATISGTANEITVSGSGTETAGVTISLPNDVVSSSFKGGNVKISANKLESVTGGLSIAASNGTISLQDNTIVSGNFSATGEGTFGTLDVTSDAIIRGDLYVEGTTTTVNSNEVTIGDNIIILNADETGTPSQNGGIEIERGTSSNVSVEWNETSDRWQFTDTAGTWNMIRPASDTILSFIDGDGTSVSADTNDSLKFVEGSGIDINFTGTSEPVFNLQVTNTDRGSSQNIFKNITAQNADSSSIGTIVADNNNDTLTIREGQVSSTQGIELAVDSSGDALTISHADTSSVANLNSNNSGNTFIQDISLTFDTYGHVTGATASTGVVNQTNFQVEDGDGTEVTIVDGKEWKFVEGAGDGASIDINWTDTTPGSDADPFDLTFAVTNTDKGSTQNIFKNIAVSDTNSGYTWSETGTVVADNNNDTVTFVGGKDIDVDVDPSSDAILISMPTTYDNYVSWTAKDSDGTTYTVTSGDTLEYKEGTSIDVNFTADDQLTISHKDITRSDTTQTFPDGIAVTGVSTNAQGHVTGVETYDFDQRYMAIATFDNYVSWTAKDSDGTIYPITSGDILQFVEGTSIDVNFTADDQITITHKDTTRTDTTDSSPDGVVVTGVSTNAQGHVTGVETYDMDSRFLNSTGGTLSGNLKLEDNARLNLGTGSDIEIYCNGSDFYTDVNGGMNWYLRDGNNSNVTRFTFDIDNGNFSSSGSISASSVSTSGNISASGNITCSGSITASGDITAFSDSRLKSEVERIDNAIGKVTELSGYTFFTKGQSDRSTGVIAQEVERVLPEAVKENSEGMKSVAYGNMVGLLIESIKDLKAEIEEIKTLINK